MAALVLPQVTSTEEGLPVEEAMLKKKKGSPEEDTQEQEGACKTSSQSREETEGHPKIRQCQDDLLGLQPRREKNKAARKAVRKMV